MVQMNCIDMNAWYSRVDKPDRPDYVVFDLDPPESRNGFVQAIRVAHLVREALERLELQSYVKTSGADGIHVLVPITRRYSYPEAYELAELVSRGLEADHRGSSRRSGSNGSAAVCWSTTVRTGTERRSPLPTRCGRAGSPGVDAAALGGARRESAAARLRDARGAGAAREARRPVRACAPGRTGVGAGAALAARVRGAVVIGSGPNGLAAAITMARAGWEVTVHEAEETVGGGVRSAELTLPGFLHDVCSAIHPLGRYSPFFRDLELPVEWVEPPAEAAHPLDDGTAVIVERSYLETAARLGEDGDAYTRLFRPVVDEWSRLERSILGPHPAPPRALLSALPIARNGLECPLAREPVPHERARALLAGHAAHSILPLDKRPSGGVGLFLGATAHVYGWGFPRGGSQRIADTLADRLRGSAVRSSPAAGSTAPKGRRGSRRRRAA